MKWEVQLNNHKHDIRNSKGSFPYLFRRIKARDLQSSKNVAYYIILDIFQDIVLIKSSRFWKIKANCASAGQASFLADKVTPTCLVLHTDYLYPQDFVSGTFGTQDLVLLPHFCENFLFVNY